MAVTYESAGVSPGASSTAIVITKPTGLAVGDTMLAAIAHNGNRTVTPPSGMAAVSGSLVTFGSNPTALELYWKIADSGDAAASDFTFTLSGGATENIGAMFRMTGTATTAGAFNTPTTATGSASAALNPAAQTFAVDSQIVVIAGASDGANTWTSSVAGSNQTLAERVDISTASGSDMSLTMSTVIPSAGQSNLSTGTITVDANDSPSTNVGALAVLVRHPIAATASPSTVTLTATLPASSISAGATLDVSAVSATSTLPAPSVSAATNPWSNETKHTSTWTTQDKS